MLLADRLELSLMETGDGPPMADTGIELEAPVVHIEQTGLGEDIPIWQGCLHAASSPNSDIAKFDPPGL